MGVQSRLDSVFVIFSEMGETLQVKRGELLIYVIHRGVLSSCRIQRVPLSVV